MPAEIIWSPQAREDLKEIARFIGRDSPAHAEAVVRKIEAAVDDLTLFPFLGHAVPEYKRGLLREVSVFSYRVIYRPGRKQIDIIGVIHGARLLRKALRGRRKA